MPKLVEPTIAVRASFLVAMQEFAEEGRGGDDTMVGRDLVEWGGRWETDEGFAAYVDTIVRARDEDAPRDPGWVPCTTLWWIDDSTYLGRIAIRHRLTPTLREVGGHIGYDIRRSARRQGHATAMGCRVDAARVGDPDALLLDETRRPRTRSTACWSGPNVTSSMLVTLSPAPHPCRPLSLATPVRWADRSPPTPRRWVSR